MGDRHQNFARKLAATDSKTREKTIKVLSKWLSRQPSVTEMDLAKIWKGLFFCMWMSDKPVVQMELASRLAKLVHVMPGDKGLLFLEVFFSTMIREWPTIDRLRIDKFYSLLRFALQEAFVYAGQRSWDPECCASLLGVLFSGPLSPAGAKSALAILFHGLDVYLDGLSTALSTYPADRDTVQALLEPLLHILASCEDTRIVTRVASAVMEPLLTHLLGHLDADAADNHAHVPGKQGVALVARCLDLPALVQRLFDMAADPDTIEKNRDLLYRLHASFSELLPPHDEPSLPDQWPDESTAAAREGSKAAKPKAKKRKGGREVPPESPHAVGDETEKHTAAALEPEAAPRRKKKRARRTDDDAEAAAEVGAVAEEQRTAAVAADVPLPERKTKKKPARKARAEAGEESSVASEVRETHVGSSEAPDAAEGSADAQHEPTRKRKRRRKGANSSAAGGTTPTASAAESSGRVGGAGVPASGTSNGSSTTRQNQPMASPAPKRQSSGRGDAQAHTPHWQLHSQDVQRRNSPSPSTQKNVTFDLKSTTVVCFTKGSLPSVSPPAKEPSPPPVGVLKSPPPRNQPSNVKQRNTSPHASATSSTHPNHMTNLHGRKKAVDFF